MCHRLGRGLVPMLAAVLQANGLAFDQALVHPSDLRGAYASIAKQYREGDPGAQSRLLALGPLRLRMLLDLIARHPERLEARVWTPELLRAAALLHTEIALPAYELGDSGTFQEHVDAADRLLTVVDSPGPPADFRAAWHIMVGLHLLGTGDIRGARDFLVHSCETLPARAQLRLACGMAIALYASRLKVVPFEPASGTSDRGREAIRLSDEQRRLTRERSGMLDAAENHLKAALATDPSLDEARLRLAWIQVERRKDTDAERLLTPLAALKQPVPLAYLARLMLGAIREREHRADAAATLYRDASALLPDAPRAALALANLLHATGDRAASRHIVERIVTLRLNPPEDPWTQYPVDFIGTKYRTMDDLRREVRK